MRILLLSNSHLPRIGGKEIVVHELAVAYRELGHEVVVAGPGGWWRYRHFQPGYPIYRWPNAPRRLAPLAWRAMLELSLARFPCDVIHAHTTYPSGYVALKSGAGERVPVIITPHGADIHKAPEINFGKRLDPEMERHIGWSVQQANYSTAISHAVRASLLDAGASPERIVYIPNGVDMRRFRTAQEFDVLGHFGLPRDSRLIVSIGNYHPRKGHEVLIDAIAELVKEDPRVRLLIVGRKSPELVTKVEAMGLSEFIAFSGMIRYPMPGSTGPDVLSAILQSATAYVSSSVSQGTEGLSLALLEAMAARTCIVATRVSGNEDLIDNDRNGLLVDPGSSQALAAGLRKVVQCETLRCRLIGAGNRTVETYTWQAVASQYVDLFERAIAEQAP